MKLTNGKYTVEALGTLLDDWTYNDASTYENMTDQNNLKGINFSIEMIKFLKTYNINNNIPKELLNNYKEVNLNLNLEHEGYDDIQSIRVDFPQWKEEKYYYASQLNASDIKATKDTYFLGYILLVRVVFARMIHLGHIKPDISKEKAIEILIGL